jgi:hypothetical protein
MGAYLPKGQEIGTVAEIDSLVVRTIVDQEDGELVYKQSDELHTGKPNPNIQVLFVSDLLARDAVPATAGQFIASAQSKLPNLGLAQEGGGDTAMNPSDPRHEHPLVSQFQFNLRVNNPDGHYNPGQRVYVRFRLEKRTLIWNGIRRMWQLLQSHENDSKLT